MEMDSMSNVKQIPQEAGLDHTLSLLREGYLYILNRRRSFNSDIFKTRLLGKKVICMGGKEAAQLFYDPEKFKRKTAAPNRLIQTLFGRNAIQTLDGQKHFHRKEMLMSVMTPTELDKLTQIFTNEWELAIEKWIQLDRVILYYEVQEILCRTACRWVGIPLKESEVLRLTEDVRIIFESAAAIGLKHWRGRNARNRVESWVEEHVENVRKGRENYNKHTAIYQFATYRNGQGNLLKSKVVAVEVVNLLRPIVAISVFINFIALAIHHYPEERDKLTANEDAYHYEFIQEVRRYYPFFPFVAGLVKKDFTWKGYQFKKDTLTFLDLYGTNHDPKIWDNPEIFRPSRFAEWKDSLYNFIPQGGGEYALGHRCAGELVTIKMMKVSLDYLVNRLHYQLPFQDLSYRMVTIPSIPHSKVVIKNVRRRKSSM